MRLENQYPLRFISGYQSLGETLIVYTLSCAYFRMSNTSVYHNTKRQRMGSDSLAYIENGGIGKIINFFDLNLNENVLLDTFFYLAE